MKWIEINVDCPSKSSMNEYLAKYVKPILNEYRDRVQSWHFLWEGKPYPLSLMIRFLGDDATISNLKKLLESEFKDIRHCFGRHGECEASKEYEGEADCWGSEGWKRGLSFLEFGSEFALELIENGKSLGHTAEYKKEIDFYADRYTHLFLNQIGSLLDETDFYLDEGVFRYGCKKGKMIPREKRKTILEKIKQRLIKILRPKTSFSPPYLEES